MKSYRILGCLAVALMGCLSVGVASAAGVDPGALVAQAPDLTNGLLLASAAAAVPLGEAVPVTMRAKLQVGFVHVHTENRNAEGLYDPDSPPVKTSETLQMYAVCAPKYDDSGLDEDNTYAKFSPGAQLSINIANPALWDQFKVGDRFYVDFTKAPS